MAFVYVTQEQSKLNYLPAEKYGQIQFITRDEFSPVAASLNNQRMMASIRDMIARFNADDDYLVCSGSPIVAAAVFATMGHMGVCAFRVLRWSNLNSSYTPILITIAKERVHHV